jgi:hypothetical protein
MYQVWSDHSLELSTKPKQDSASCSVVLAQVGSKWQAVIAPA